LSVVAPDKNFKGGQKNAQKFNLEISKSSFGFTKQDLGDLNRNNLTPK